MAGLLVEVERLLSSVVDSVEAIDGGYTPQRVRRLRLATGQKLVLKAAPPGSVDVRLDWPAELEREIELYRSHPELDRWRPKSRAEVSFGGWRGLLMEDLSVSFRPPPWTGAALQSVATGLAAMHAASIGAGHGIIHGDVRSDNLFLVTGRGLVLCDWAEATQGSVLQDAVYWAVGVELEGGGPACDAFARYASAAGDCEPTESGAQAAATKLFLLNRRRLERPGEPVRVRELRIRELAVLRRWLSA
jgi:hypothetical protein